MADAVQAITHWRRGRDQHTEHTREVVQELPDGARAALIMMAERIERLEQEVAEVQLLKRVIASLAAEAARED